MPGGDGKYTVAQGVTQSLLGLWCSCRVAARYKLDGWRRGGISRAIQFGTLCHLILERFYGGDWSDEQEGMLLTLRGVEKDWRNESRKIGDDAQAVERDLAMAYGLMPGYVAFHSRKDRAILWDGQEEMFDVEIEGFRLRGKIDGRFRRKDKSRWLFETKTKSYIRQEDMGEALAFDWQNLFYLVAAEGFYKRRFSGVLYNIIRVPQFRSEDLRALKKQIEAAVLEEPEKWFLRYEIAYPVERVDQFREELKVKLVMFDEWLRNPEMSMTYRNESACVARWTCEYLSACASGSTTGYDREPFCFRELEEKG